MPGVRGAAFAGRASQVLPLPLLGVAVPVDAGSAMQEASRGGASMSGKIKPIKFLAYLPPIQTALTISGDGDLLRIKLDCNLSISPDAARLLTMTGKRLMVTIEESLTNFDAKGKNETEKDAKGSSPKVDRRRIANRRNQRKG